MASTVDECSSNNLRDDCNSLDTKRVSVDRRLRETSFVVLEPEEKHALEGEGFRHGTNDREGREDISGTESIPYIGVTVGLLTWLVSREDA